MWYAAEDCSRSVQRRLEKLGRRRLRVWYGEQTVYKTKRNADAFETPTLLDDEVRQRGMTVPGHEDICKPGDVTYCLWSRRFVCLLNKITEKLFLSRQHSNTDAPYSFDIANMSVRPSVCLSRSGVVSKRLNIIVCYLQRMVVVPW